MIRIPIPAGGAQPPLSPTALECHKKKRFGAKGQPESGFLQNPPKGKKKARGVICFPPRSPPPGRLRCVFSWSGRSLTSPPRCTSSPHLCWQRSKDRSQQRLSARAVLIGGSCSLKRLLNNVKKLRCIFKSLLSEPSSPSSSLAPPPSLPAPTPRRCGGPGGSHVVTLVAQRQLSHWCGPRGHSSVPKGGRWKVCRGVPAPPGSSSEQRPPNKSHGQEPVSRKTQWDA